MEELPELAGPLATLDEEDRRALAAIGTWRSFEPGELLLRQGETSRALYVLGRGRVRVVLGAADGRELLLAVLGPGATVGELTVLDGEPRSASVVALEPVRALRVAGEVFGRFLLARPAVVVGLLRVLSARLRDCDRRSLGLVVAQTDQRLARALLELAADHGEVGDEGVEVAVRLSQSDLAAFVGASRESVNEALGRLRESGVVDTGRMSVTIRDVDGLRQLAGL